MAVAIPFIMIAGAAISAVGAVQAAQAQKTASQYNAAIHDRNAVVAKQQTDAAVAQQRRQAAQVHGSIVAGYGASGVTLEGSPLDVLSHSTMLAIMDEQTIKYRGNLQAMGLQESSNLERLSGKTAEQQGYMNAASQFLMGMGQAGATHSYMRR